MQSGSLGKMLARLALALSLFAVMVPVGTREAAAGFGVSAADNAEADKAKGASGGYTSEELKAREEARKRLEEEEAANPNPTPPKASVAKVVKPAPPPVVKKDEEVAGCTVGQICIICVAGCNDKPNAIVHSISNKQRAQ